MPRIQRANERTRMAYVRAWRNWRESQPGDEPNHVIAFAYAHGFYIIIASL